MALLETSKLVFLQYSFNFLNRTQKILHFRTRFYDFMFESIKVINSFVIRRGPRMLVTPHFSAQRLEIGYPKKFAIAQFSLVFN